MSLIIIFTISVFPKLCVCVCVCVCVIFVPFCSDNPVLNFTRNLHPPKEGVVRGSEMQDNVLVAALCTLPSSGELGHPEI